MEEDYKTTPLTKESLAEHAATNGNGNPEPCDDCREEETDLHALARIPKRMEAVERQLRLQEAALYVLIGALIYLAWKVAD